MEFTKGSELDRLLTLKALLSDPEHVTQKNVEFARWHWEGLHGGMSDECVIEYLNRFFDLKLTPFRPRWFWN